MMRVIHRTYWLWLLILLLAMPAAVLAGDDDARAVREDYVPGEVLVKFKTGASPKHLRSFARIGVRHWRLGKGLSVEKALEILAKRKNVEYAEPNYVVTANDMPNDPLRGDLWNMHNTGQLGTPDADIDAPEAWDLATDASSVIVAVIDSGIEYAHEDLAANMWTNAAELNGVEGVDDDGNGVIDDIHGANFIGDGDPTGDPMDDYWHGTQIAGIIGAVGDNGIGVVGVCWKVQLMALKCLDNVGSGSIADVLEAIEYAASYNARVMNCSWGSGKRSKSFEAAIKASGALFVASAGNSSSDRKQYPAAMALDNVIAVAATDPFDELADFSNYGSWVHLAAPGEYIRSTGGLPINVYGTKSSTSRASAHVAGAAALAIAYLGGDNAAVKTALLDGVDLISSLTGVVSSGGRLNLFRTLGGTPTPGGDTTPPAAVTDLTAGTATDFMVPLTWTATGDDDGLPGIAHAYDLRYATTEIGDEAAWGSAYRASGEPIPQVTGSTESFVLEGLASLTTYYFALKVLDEAGNASPFSNVASATTLEAPWTTEVIDSSGGYHSHKALDFYAGTEPGTFPVGCAHSDEDTIVAVLWNGTAWQREVVDSSVSRGAGIDFAFAPDGTPTVSYGWGKIRFARRQTNGTWKVESIEKGRANNEYTALVYDPSTGEPTVAYRKGSKLQFARKVGGLNGTWQAETVEAADARYTDMVYDWEGRPVIAYSYDDNGDGFLSALRVATRIGGSWVTETLHEGTRGYGVYACIAVDPTDGDLLIAHAANNRIIAFRKTHLGSWQDAEAEALGVGGGIHAVFREDGIPFISCIRLGQTFVTYHDGGAWQSERVADYARPRTDIRRDPAGGLGVLYGRQGGGVGLGRQE